MKTLLKFLGLAVISISTASNFDMACSNDINNPDSSYIKLQLNVSSIAEIYATKGTNFYLYFFKKDVVFIDYSTILPTYFWTKILPPGPTLKVKDGPEWGTSFVIENDDLSTSITTDLGLPVAEAYNNATSEAWKKSQTLESVSFNLKVSTSDVDFHKITLESYTVNKI